MESDYSLLEQIRIASPCTASWEEMRGDERVRYCHHCRLNVYNLSAMEPAEAEALVREKEGRLCVRFYARRDGTMLTKDCPVGFRAARRRVLVQLAAIATGGVGMIHSAFVIRREVRRVTVEVRPTPVVRRVEPATQRPTMMGSPAPLPPTRTGRIAPRPAKSEGVMGKLALPAPPKGSSEGRQMMGLMGEVRVPVRKETR